MTAAGRMPILSANCVKTLNKTQYINHRRPLVSLILIHQRPKEGMLLPSCPDTSTQQKRQTSHTALTHHNHFTALFRDHPGEPVPEENFWTLWCKGRLTEADTPTIRLGATPSGLTSAYLHHPRIFYRLVALPVAQPTASSEVK